MGGPGTTDPEALIKVGWIGSTPRGGLGGAFDVEIVPPIDLAAVLSRPVDVWVVEAALVIDRLRDALLATGLPVILRSSARTLHHWWPLVETGRVDVVLSSARADELCARVIGAVERTRSFNALTAKLSATVAHDLRSSLQALRLVLMALEREGALTGTHAEDLDVMLSSSENLELMLNGLYNLGRKPMPDRGELLDVGAAMAEEVSRRTFHDRVDLHVDAGCHVRGNAADLRAALLELLRIGQQMAPGQRRIVLDVRRTGTLVRVIADIPVWATAIPHIDRLMTRETGILLRGRVRLPFAGLAFSRDVIKSSDGDMEVSAPGGDVLRIQMRLPAVDA